MGNHRTKTTSCPKCGHALSAAANAVSGSNAKPRPGDLSLCVGCGSTLRFTSDLGVVEIGPHEEAQLSDEEKDVLEEARAVLYKIHSARRNQ